MSVAADNDDDDETSSDISNEDEAGMSRDRVVSSEERADERSSGDSDDMADGSTQRVRVDCPYRRDWSKLAVIKPLST